MKGADAFLARTVDRLLDRLDHLDDSFENWHVAGVDYLCLLRSPKLTVKLYSFGELPLNCLGVSVWPHNHRYGFTNLTLEGRIEQVLCGLTPKSSAEWMSSRCYPMRQDHPEASRAGLEVLSRSDAPLWSMTALEVHAILAEPGSLALQFQHEDTLPPESPTWMYVPIGEQMACGSAEMYRPLSLAKAEAIARRARALVARLAS